MYSYRHEFHSGNHADVFKHSVLIHILEHLNNKKSFEIIDTHSGAGLYNLNSDWAKKNNEFKNGIEKIWKLNEIGIPNFIKKYLLTIKKFNKNDLLEFYPGSPFISMMFMRKNSEHLFLSELHSSEINILKSNIQSQYLNKNTISIFHEDGFKKLISLIPTKSRRALIFIDPSYENKMDYKILIMTIKNALKKFPNAIFMIWYPKIQNLFSINMARKLENIVNNRNWLHASLIINKPDISNYRLHGSGIFIINPPWTLFAELKYNLPFLVKVLGQDNFARFELKTNSI